MLFNSWMVRIVYKSPLILYIDTVYYIAKTQDSDVLWYDLVLK